MLNPIKKAAARTSQFVSDHKVAIAVVATATATTAVALAMTRSARTQWNDFLAEKGLTDEFYNSEDLIDTLTNN